MSLLVCLPVYVPLYCIVTVRQPCVYAPDWPEGFPVPACLNHSGFVTIRFHGLQAAHGGVVSDRVVTMGRPGATADLGLTLWGERKARRYLEHHFTPSTHSLIQSLKVPVAQALRTHSLATVR